MIRKFAHYCTALVLLAAMAIIYQMITSVWLRPPRVQTVQPREEITQGVDQSLADLFPAGAWQRGLCKRLRTDDGVLLFEKWEQTSDDHWKLWPITLVVGRGMSGDLDPAPVIMEASHGAEIKFTESFDVMSGERTTDQKRTVDRTSPYSTRRQIWSRPITFDPNLQRRHQRTQSLDDRNGSHEVRPGFDGRP